jgi:hypothetical protein
MNAAGLGGTTLVQIHPLSTVSLPEKPFATHGAGATSPNYFFSAFSGFFGPSTGGSALM